MEDMVGHIARTEEWQGAVRRWADDPNYPTGERTWNMIIGHPPGASEENPGWGEAYARAAELPWASLPPYIQEFLPWRLSDTEARQDIEPWRPRGIWQTPPTGLPPATRLTEEQRGWLDEAYAKMDAELRGRRMQGIR